MNQSTISILSFGVSFHFNDYGRIGNVWAVQQCEACKVCEPTVKYNNMIEVTKCNLNLPDSIYNNLNTQVSKL